MKDKLFNIILWVYYSRKKKKTKTTCGTKHCLVSARCPTCSQALHLVVLTVEEPFSIFGSILKRHWPWLSSCCWQFAPLPDANWCKGKMRWVILSDYVLLKSSGHPWPAVLPEITKCFNRRNIGVLSHCFLSQQHPGCTGATWRVLLEQFCSLSITSV